MCKTGEGTEYGGGTESFVIEVWWIWLEVERWCIQSEVWKNYSVGYARKNIIYENRTYPN